VKLNSDFLTNIIGPFLGVVIGMASTVYALGFSKANTEQRINENTNNIAKIQSIIDGKLYDINQSLISSVSELKIQVEVLRAIVLRIEESNRNK